MSPEPTSRQSTATASMVLALVWLALLAAACSAGGEPSADEPSGDLTDVTHQLEPTDQMRQAATQQCLDDPDLAVGYIRAVDPATGNQLAEIEIDCTTVDGTDG